MSSIARWTVAVLGSGCVVAGTWVTCQAVLGLDAATSIAIATVVLTVVGVPFNVWAERNSDQSAAGERAGRGSRTRSVHPFRRSGDPATAVWNVPPRIRRFTGRDAHLSRLMDSLRSRNGAVCALHGMGGVGKTALVIEYAYRYSSKYRLVWWVDAERNQFIDEQLAGLGVRAGWVGADNPVPDALTEVKQHLRVSKDWLLIFDNVGDPDDVVSVLPSGGGHVLITSRNHNWAQVCTSFELELFTRSESRNLLKDLAPTVSDEQSERISELLGDLPLAITQAGGVMADTGIDPEDYLVEFGTQTSRVMAEGRPPTYPLSLAAAVLVSWERLRSGHPAATQLLELCTPLAPEFVPSSLFLSAGADALPAPLDVESGSAFGLHLLLSRIERLGLARVEQRGLKLHRLTKAILADQLDAAGTRLTRQRVEALLLRIAPPDGRNPALWARWMELMPHLVEIGIDGIENPGLRSVAVEAIWYLLERGEIGRGCQLATELYTYWSASRGPDDVHTLAAGHVLASCHVRQRRWTELVPLSERILEGRRRTLGENHLDTLNAADHLATAMRHTGSLEQAVILRQDSVDRWQTGDRDDRGAMGAAHNLADDLRRLGRFDEAHALNESTYVRRRALLSGLPEVMSVTRPS